MDGLERTTPAPAMIAPVPDTAASAVPSCCSTASFPTGVVRSWLRDRRVLAVAGLVIGGSGLALGWDWLTAVGIAPLIVSAAPCLLMCALGLCMMGCGHSLNSASTAAAPDQVTPTNRDASP